MTLDDEWMPPLGCRATWLDPRRFSGREAVLAAALDRLVQHDYAADLREDAPNCVELQHAIRVLNALAGSLSFSRGSDRSCDQLTHGVASADLISDSWVLTA
jgi:hypothetical protein